MKQNTLEQYAFAIGFDFKSNAPLDEFLDSAQIETLEAIAIAIQNAGLPTIESDRWDEFGHGRIFWGTRAECDAVRQVLSQFPLFLEEERNLDAGYYANVVETYYVDESGNVYRLLKPVSRRDGGQADGNILEPVNTIPLDAYRLKSSDLNLNAAVERSLKLLRQESSSSYESLPVAAAAHQEATAATTQAAVDEIQELRNQLAQQAAQLQELEALRAEAAAAQGAPQQAAATHELHGLHELHGQLTQQTTHIHELERQVTVFEDQISFLQGVLATKIDPQQYDHLRTQFVQQTLQLQQIETRLDQAESKVKAWESKAEEWVDPQSYFQIQQQLSAKVAQIQDLEQHIQQQEQRLQDAVAIATQKVDPAKYQSLEQTVAQKMAQTEELRRAVHQLQRDLGEWQTVAESKVEWSEYQALQQEIQRLQAKQKKGILARILSRLSGGG
jgi:hypothetical protein